MKYALHKVTDSPFEFHCEDIRDLAVILETYCCELCFEESGWSVDMTVEEQVDCLLGSKCGAEFLLEIRDKESLH